MCPSAHLRMIITEATGPATTYTAIVSSALDANREGAFGIFRPRITTCGTTIRRQPPHSSDITVSGKKINALAQVTKKRSASF